MLDGLLDDVIGDDDELLLEDDLAETPMEPRPLVLNPGREGPKNPLCPRCEEHIVPLSNEYERQFTCGCEEIWRFEFGVDEASVEATTTDDS